MTDTEIGSIWHAVKWGVMWGKKKPIDAWTSGKDNTHWMVRALMAGFWGTGCVLLYTFAFGVLLGAFNYYRST